jgi:ATP-dependent Lon protease
MNQKGITYKGLFGAYMRSAHGMTVVDPYVRAPFQIDNFIELVETLRECSETPEDLTIHLSTNNDDDKIPEMIDNFESLQRDLQAVGITFTWDFKADHDRWILLDNGWKILLSRGLDIFEKPDRYSLANNHQQERRCRAFTVSFTRDKEQS